MGGISESGFVVRQGGVLACVLRLLARPAPECGEAISRDQTLWTSALDPRHSAAQRGLPASNPPRVAPSGWRPARHAGAGEGGGPCGVFAGSVTTANNGGFASVRTRNLEPPLDLSGGVGWD